MPYEGSEKEPMTTLTFGVSQQPTPLATPTSPEAEMGERTPSEPTRAGPHEGILSLEATSTITVSTGSAVATNARVYDNVPTTSGNVVSIQ